MYKEYKEKLFFHLNKLRTDDGFFMASDGPFYKKFTWWRDNFYACLPYLENYPDMYVQSYHTYLDQLHFLEDKYGKFTHMINNPNQTTYMYLHARIDLATRDEVDGEWGNKQNDATGYILLGIYYGEREGLNIIRDERDRILIQKIIKYLEAVKYYHWADSGAWEENEELRSSSLGVCMHALSKIRELDFEVDSSLLNIARKQFTRLLGSETNTRAVDLAMLFLPFLDITENIDTKYIVSKVERLLVREHGVQRYENDVYYSHMHNDSKQEFYGAPEWVFGLGYLSSIYSKLGEREIAKFYLDKIVDTWDDGRVPELVYLDTNPPVPNDNRVLAWSNAMTILAIDNLK